MSSSSLFDFAVITIFAREFLEGAIIIGEYRTIVLRSATAVDNAQRNRALSAIWTSAAIATIVALLVIAAVAIPLAILSSTLDTTTAKIIEGVSKIVAGICLLQLSLKLPKFLGIYVSCKKQNKNNNDLILLSTPGVQTFDEETNQIEQDKSNKATDQVRQEGAPGEQDNPVQQNASDEENAVPEKIEWLSPVVEQDVTQQEQPPRNSKSNNCHDDDDDNDEVMPGLTMRSIRFNVAWNIWREVAECGVFLIPFFLSGENLKAIPLSSFIGSLVGLMLGLAIYVANQRFRDKRGLCIFAVLLLVFLSAGLMTGGVHNIEGELGSTRTVWSLSGQFWDVNRLPMTILKPFGYNDSRTILEICMYWGSLSLSLALHVRKYRRAAKVQVKAESAETSEDLNDPEDEDDVILDEESDVSSAGAKSLSSDLDRNNKRGSSRSTEENSD